MVKKTNSILIAAVVALLVFASLVFFISWRSNPLLNEHCRMVPGLSECQKYQNTYQEESSFFDREIKDLELSKSSSIINLKSEEQVELSVSEVRKIINGNEIKMFAYNGEIPGPLINVKQGETIYVNVKNDLDMETTVHWHGVRLENSFDGVPELTQSPIQPGESFEYKLTFPDAGIYWYHPHVREDYQQELGLYGNILVTPSDSKLMNEVNSEEFLILDDIQFQGEDITPLYKEKINQVLMGRFGDIMLINGEEKYDITVKKGEVVRFYLTNVANTRVFNFKIENHKLKVIGSDSGIYEKEFWADSVVLSPSERAVVEVKFDSPGEFVMSNSNPLRSYDLGTIEVSNSEVENQIQNFENLRENEIVSDELVPFKSYLSKEPDVNLKLDIEFPAMRMGRHMMAGMHFEEDGIEWEDTMKPMNLASSSNTVNWLITDMKTKKSNDQIKYNWKVGDKVKIRIFNDPNSPHPMQHPIHFHGQRFLVLSVDGIPNDNLVWKDTILVPSGKEVDIFLDVTNPGDWMVHCHIAEHLSDGMMFSFGVEDV